MFYDLLQKRKSVRKFLDKKITASDIKKLIDAALISPTSRNTNGWSFIVVDDRLILNKLSVSKHGAALLSSATLGIIIAMDSKVSDVWVEDASIAASNLLLMAEELDIGACWVQIRNRFMDDKTTAEEYVKSLVDIPQNLSVECIIGFGYPVEKNILKEKKLDYSKVKYNSYDNDFFIK